jgi:hypothetical protein
MFQFNRGLALVIGVVTPALETVRRWHQLITLTVPWPGYLDDVLLGAFLILGAWRAGRGPSGRLVLAAAWGFLCGHAYGSFFEQLGVLDQPDPSGLAPAFIVAIKGLGLVLGVIGVVTSLAAGVPIVPLISPAPVEKRRDS